MRRDGENLCTGIDCRVRVPRESTIRALDADCTARGSVSRYCFINFHRGYRRATQQIRVGQLGFQQPARTVLRADQNAPAGSHTADSEGDVVRRLAGRTVQCRDFVVHREVGRLQGEAVGADQRGAGRLAAHRRRYCASRDRASRGRDATLCH